MILKFGIERFLSFNAPQEFNLKPLTVVVGANNSGKSNLILAFRFLAEFAKTKDLNQCAHSIGRNLRTLFFSNPVPIVPFVPNAFRITAETLEFRYGLIAFQNEIKPEIWTNDELFVKQIDIPNSERQTGPTHKSERGTLFAQPNVDCQLAAHYFQRIRYFKFLPTELAKPSQINITPALRYDGAGLSGLLDHLRGETPDVYERIEDDFKRLVPEIERILLRTVADGQKVVLLKHRGFKEPFSASEISDGLLLFLALLCCINTQPAPTLICLDEPDTGIHPRRFKEMISQFRGITQRKENPVQILMTTHSPYILDWFKDDLDAVLVLDRKDDGTVVRTASAALGPGGLQGSPLGEVWYSGIMGGVPA